MFFKVFPFLFLALFLFSCKKKKTDNPTVQGETKRGFLVLNEGLFNLNNSTLSFHSTEGKGDELDYFEARNGRGLGDTGNDMLRYGSKIYVLVNVSSTVEVLAYKTGKSIQQIPLQFNGKSAQPRSCVAYGGKVWITCFDGFVRAIDTTSFEVVHTIKVGQNPEGITIYGNRAFVANSGGLDAPVYDSTVSVLDLLTATEIGKIKVGKNAGALAATSNGKIIVGVRGNYSSIKPKMVFIDALNLNVINSLNISFKSFTLKQDNEIYLAYTDNQNTSKIGIFNTENYNWTNDNWLALNSFQTFYGMQWDEKGKRLFCFDAKGYTKSGEVLVFDQFGSKNLSFNTGLNPNSLLIYED